MWSPIGWVIIYVWTFASLTAVQLTVRLIRRFEVRETALAALWLTVAAVLVALAFVAAVDAAVDPAALERLRAQGEAAAGGGERLVQVYLVGQRLRWLPLAMLPLAGVSWLVARRVLVMRPRSALICAAAMALLIAPWHALWLT